MSPTAILSTPNPVASASTLKGNKVVNNEGKDLGKIEELMIDFKRGQIAYAVMSFGGFLGMGDKLFAIPWSVIEFDPTEECFILNVSKELLKDAPGFDKTNWPNMADLRWGGSVYEYYGQRPYWAIEHGPRQTKA